MQSEYAAGIAGALEFGTQRLRALLADTTPEQLSFVPAGFQNSIAGLVTHLCGSLVKFSHILAEEPLPDDLAATFLLNQPQNPLPRPEGETADSLLAKMDKARAIATEVLNNLTPADLSKSWQRPDGGWWPFQTVLALLPVHVGQHMGHIQYIKRMAGQ